MILDGGPTAHGIESTVLDATGERIVMLRSGATMAETIEAVLGEKIGRATRGRRRATLARPACEPLRAERARAARMRGM